MSYNPIIISGPSGAGKTELINYIEKRDPIFLEATGITTRERRESDNGRMDYVSFSEFEERIKTGDLIEYTLYNNNYYGVSKEEYKKLDNRSLIFNVGYSSARIIQQEYLKSILIYLLPPNRDELLRRLGDRGYNRFLSGIEETLNNSKYYQYLLISRTNDFESTYGDFIDIISKSDGSIDKQMILRRNMDFVNNFYN